MRLGQIVLRLHDQMRPADLEMQTRPPKESCQRSRRPYRGLIDLDAAAAQERSNPENERREEQTMPMKATPTTMSMPSGVDAYSMMASINDLL